MKPIYEPIDTGAHTSFKVHCYKSRSNCDYAGWHIHPEYEMVYVKNGNGVLHIGSKTHHYTHGTLVLLGGNIPHSDFGNKQYRDGMEVVVQFSQDFVDTKLHQFPETAAIRKLIDNAKQVLIFDTATKNHLSRHFERFSELDPQRKLINLLSILDHLSTHGNPTPLFYNGLPYLHREKEYDRLRQIFDYINGNYAEKITATAVAEQVGLTPNSFSRFFKKMTKRTFIDFLNELRIRKAMEIMDSEAITVAEAMYRSGFRSASYFSQQFYKYQKQQPSSYLNRQS